MTIVTAHPLGYLPSVSVMAKLAEADVVIWLDSIRYTSPGWINRNRLPDGTWLAVPVDRPSADARIRDVTIADEVREPDDGLLTSTVSTWRETHVRAIRDRYQREPHFDNAIVNLIATGFAGDRLVDLNAAIVDAMLIGLDVSIRQVWQSDYAATTTSLSDKLARMIHDLGGTTFLGGPGDRRRLDPRVFDRVGVRLSFFHFAGDNPSAIDPLYRAGILPKPSGEGHRQAVIAS